MQQQGKMCKECGEITIVCIKMSDIALEKVLTRKVAGSKSKRASTQRSECMTKEYWDNKHDIFIIIIKKL